MNTETIEEKIPGYLKTLALPFIGEGWTVIFTTTIYKNTDWETGVKIFRAKGYKNLLTLPATIIPTTWTREKVLEFYPNAIVATIWAEATTCNQPKGWTGEVQIPVEHRRNEWKETQLMAVKKAA